MMQFRPGLRWYQFRLRTLLIAVTICGVFGSLYARHRMLRDARAAYDKEMAGYEQGFATLESLCEASLALRDVESQRFALGNKAAGKAHIERMRELESIALGRTVVGVWSDINAPRRTLDQVRKCREEAEQWLLLIPAWPMTPLLHRGI